MNRGRGGGAVWKCLKNFTNDPSIKNLFSSLLATAGNQDDSKKIHDDKNPETAISILWLSAITFE